MKRRALQCALGEIAEAAIPRDTDGWPDIRARLQSRHAPTAAGGERLPVSSSSSSPVSWTAPAPARPALAPRPVRTRILAAANVLAGIALVITLTFAAGLLLRPRPAAHSPAGTPATGQDETAVSRVAAAPVVASPPQPTPACPSDDTASAAAILRCAFLAVPDLAPVERAAAAREVHLAQTVEGVTVTMGRVYAGTDQIAIGYVLDRGGPLILPERLTDGAGRVYRPANAVPGYRVGPYVALVVLFRPVDESPPPGDETFTLSMAATTGPPQNRTAPTGDWSFTFTVPVVASPAP